MCPNWVIWLLGSNLVITLVLHFTCVVWLSKPLYKAQNDKDLKEKYKPFWREDMHKFSLLNFRVFFQTHTAFIRILIGFAFVFLTFLWLTICTAGLDLDNPKIGPTRRKFIRVGVAVLTRPIVFFSGMYWINVEYVSTGEGDYRKWLGPDWKPEWDNATTIVSNHVSWMDIIVALVYFCPAFVAKKSVKSYPGVGRIAIAINSVFIDRAGSKDAKK